MVNEKELLLISKLLRKLGIPVSYLGYDYIRLAIILCLGDHSYRFNITTKLYPELAERFGTTSSRVERAMRYAIITGFNQGDKLLLGKLFECAISNHKKSVSNSEFVSTIADLIDIGEITLEGLD